MKNATTGEHLFTSRARYDMRDEPWYLTKMSLFSELPGIAVEAGDELRLTAVYDSSRNWQDVMGIMLGALAPSV